MNDSERIELIRYKIFKARESLKPHCEPQQGVWRVLELVVEYIDFMITSSKK